MIDPNLIVAIDMQLILKERPKKIGKGTIGQMLPSYLKGNLIRTITS
jgi:hypothetical protein